MGWWNILYIFKLIQTNRLDTGHTALHRSLERFFRPLRLHSNALCFAISRSISGPIGLHPWWWLSHWRVGCLITRGWARDRFKMKQPCIFGCKVRSETCVYFVHVLFLKYIIRMAKYSYIENIVDNGNTNVHCTVHVFFLLENLMFFQLGWTSLTVTTEWRFGS